VFEMEQSDKDQLVMGAMFFVKIFFDEQFWITIKTNYNFLTVDIN
jgi:hypothetical protein